MILDFDGVIVDSEGLQMQAVNRVLASYDVVLDRQTWIDRWIGHKTRDVLPGFLRTPIGDEELERLLATKSATYQQVIMEMVPEARPGIRELLEAATARGYRCGIASATRESDLRYFVGILGLGAFFETIVSSDAVARPKPAPDVYLRAAEILGVAPHHCVIIEDTPTGLAAGRAAGMHCVAFPNDWTATFDLSAAECIEPVLERAAIERILDLAET